MIHISNMIRYVPYIPTDVCTTEVLEVGYVYDWQVKQVMEAIKHLHYTEQYEPFVFKNYQTHDSQYIWDIYRNILWIQMKQ